MHGMTSIRASCPCGGSFVGFGFGSSGAGYFASSVDFSEAEIGPRTQLCTLLVEADGHQGYLAQKDAIKAGEHGATNDYPSMSTAPRTVRFCTKTHCVTEFHSASDVNSVRCSCACEVIHY